MLQTKTVLNTIHICKWKFSLWEDKYEYLFLKCHPSHQHLNSVQPIAVIYLCHSAWATSLNSLPSAIMTHSTKFNPSWCSLPALITTSIMSLPSPLLFFAFIHLFFYVINIHFDTAVQVVITQWVLHSFLPLFPLSVYLQFFFFSKYPSPGHASDFCLISSWSCQHFSLDFFPSLHFLCSFSSNFLAFPLLHQ